MSELNLDILIKHRLFRWLLLFQIKRFVSKNKEIFDILGEMIK